VRNPAIITKKIPVRTKNYKLTIAQVLLIKQMLRTGKNRIKMIAKQFGITSTQVNRIKNGANWKQVNLK
jgi:DNA invertase Pin-like site-specific DNA recombinase